MKLLFAILSLTAACGSHRTIRSLDYYRYSELQAALDNARSNLILQGNEFSFRRDKFDNANVNLFQGLLCSVGELWACDGIKDLQKYTFLCRNKSYCEQGPLLLNAASRDELLGRMLYWSITKDLPTHSYIVNGKICLNSSDSRCDVTPMGQPAIYRLLNHFGLYNDKILTDSAYLLAQSKLSPVGYTLHLQAVLLYLYDLNGLSGLLNDEAKKVLVKRDPGNEFYEYLLNGTSKRAVDLLLSHVPKTYEKQTQWWTQCWTQEKVWTKGNAANTIFLVKLLLKGK